MRVYIIPAWFPTENRPEWGIFLLDQIKALRDIGVDAYVLQVDIDAPLEACNKVRLISHETMANQHLYYALSIVKRPFQRTRFFYGKVLRLYIQALKKLYDLAVKRWGLPDVIHAHVSLPSGYCASVLGNQEGIPVIVTEHYTGFEDDARFWWRCGYFIKSMGQKIGGFYSVSPGFGERIRRTGLVPVTGVIPNPIDTDLFFPSQYNNLDHKTFKLVTTGISRAKGTDILFAALTKIKNRFDWHLTIFGNIENQEDYSKWLSDPNFAARVSFPGIVTQKELASIFKKSDFYVVSSRTETANVSMLQAMACGIPALITKCGGPETLINNSSGIVVKKINPNALAEAIIAAYKKRDQFNPFEIRDFIEKHYSTRSVGKMLIDAYRQAIETRK